MILRRLRFGKALGITAAVALVIAALSANAQTLSLAERVARLEQQQAQQQSQGGGVSLVNQVQDLQSQLQQMQGQIEELQHQVQQLQQQNKDQYLDLDSRVGKLEGKAAPAPSSPASAGASTIAGAPAGPASSAPPSSSASTATPAGPPGAEEQSAYNAAFKSLQSGDYVAAARGFRAFTQKYPQSALAPNAYYWLGESYYVTQNYSVSLETFQSLLKDYPKSEKAPDALLKVGYCQAEMKKYGEAQATLTAVIKKYPGTTVARLAQSRLKSIKLQTAK